MPQSATQFSAIGTVETVTRSFDFNEGLVAGESLVGNPVCEITVIDGVDPNPQAHLIGGPVIIGPRIVTIYLSGMLGDVTYSIRVIVQTSKGQILSCWALQKCEQEGDTYVPPFSMSVTGVLLAIESSHDYWNFYGGTPLPLGDLIANENQDAPNIMADLVVSGSINVVETTYDGLSVFGGSISTVGVMAVNEEQSDTISAQGNAFLYSGTMSATDAPDTAAMVGDAILHLAGLDVADLADSTAVFGDVVASGALAVAEGNQDQSAIQGATSISGVISSNESVQDLSGIVGSASGSTTVSGSVSTAEAQDASNIVASVLTVTGTFDVSEPGVDGFQATARVVVAASFVVSEGTPAPPAAYASAGIRINFGGATSCTPAFPTGLAAGDLILTALGIKSNATISTPANWNKIGSQTDSGPNWTVGFYWHVYQPGDVAPTYTWTGAVAACAACLRFTNTDIVNPIGAVSTPATGLTSAHTSNALVSTQNGSYVILLDLAAVNTAFSTPSNWTARFDAAENVALTEISGVSSIVPLAGSSSGATSSTGGNAAWVSQQIELLVAAPLQNDTTAVVGNVAISGVVAIGEAPDAAAVVGGVLVSGSVATSGTQDAVSATGVAIVGGTSVISDNPDVATILGRVVISGSLTITEAQDTGTPYVVIGTVTTTADTTPPSTPTGLQATNI